LDCNAPVTSVTVPEAGRPLRAARFEPLFHVVRRLLRSVAETDSLYVLTEAELLGENGNRPRGWILQEGTEARERAPLCVQQSSNSRLPAVTKHVLDRIIESFSVARSPADRLAFGLGVGDQSVVVRSCRTAVIWDRRHRSNRCRRRAYGRC